MDLATLGLTVTAGGAIAALDRFSGAADRASKAGSRVDSAARSLSRSLVALGIGFGAREIAEMSDGWLLMGARIGLVTSSAQQQALVQQRLLQVANSTRTSLEATTTLYFRTARAADSLGRSQNELIRFTELVGKSMVIGGATIQEARQSTIQLSQSLASGRLTGDEFRTVMESMPGVARALAEHFKATGKATTATVGELYRLRDAGKITSNDIVTAVLDMGSKIDSQFEGIPMTIGQSFTVLHNNLEAFIGQGSKATGVGQGLATMIVFLSNHLATLSKISFAFGVAFTARTLNNAITGFREARMESQKLVAQKTQEAEATRAAALAQATAARQAAVAQAELTNARVRDIEVQAQQLRLELEQIAALRAGALGRLAYANSVMAGAAKVPIESIAPLGGRAVEQEMARRTAATRMASQATAELAALGVDQAAVNTRLAMTEAELAVATGAAGKASIAASEAMVAEGVAARIATVATTGFAAATAAAASVAKAFWLAIGGWIGAVILGLMAVVYWMDRVKRAHEERAAAMETFRTTLAGKSTEELTALETQTRQRFYAAADRLERDRRAHRDTRADQESVNEYVDQLTAITEAKLQNAEMDRRIGAFNPTEELTKKERARQRAIADTEAQLRALLRTSQQEVTLSGTQGMAQQELRLNYERVNEELKIRSDLHEKAISDTITEADENRLGALAARTLAEAEQNKLRALQETAKFQEKNRHEDAVRGTTDDLRIAFRFGVAQDQERIHVDYVNRALEARRNLTGEVLDMTLRNLDAEERLAQGVFLVKKFAEDLSKTFDNFFENILNNGVSSFGELFKSIKQMFFKMVAEMATDRFMQTIGKQIATNLASIFVRQGTTTAPTPATTAQTARSTVAAVAAAGSTFGTQGTVARQAELDRIARERAAATVRGTAPAVELEGGGLTVPASLTKEQQRSALVKKMAGYLTSAVVGYTLGSMFGQSGGAAAGVIGGGLSGAASGFMTAGPVGAVIGGLTGIAGGLLGASKAAAERQRIHDEVINKNSEKLNELRESINGSPLLSGKNLAAALPTSALAGGLDMTGLVGLLNRAGLSKALKGGESTADLKKLESQFGITFQQLGRIAKQIGIELFDSAGKLVPDALKQLNEAIRLTIEAATKFGNNLDDIRLRQEARNKLYDLDTPQQKLNDTFEVLNKLAPDLMKQLGLVNLNLDTEAGRNVLLNGLREIFELIDSGKLTPELLGSFTDKGQLIEAILAAKDGLDAFKNTLAKVTTDFPKAMDLLFYEQIHGTPPKTGGTTGSPGGPAIPPTTPLFSVTGGITIINAAGDPPGAILDNFEAAVRRKYGRGGVVMIPGAVTEDQ